MKLISRKKDPTLHERALGYVKLAVRALALVRVARTTHKGYKVARRLPLLLVGGGLIAFVLKKVRGGGGPEAPAQTWQPTPATTTPSTSPPAAPGTSAAAPSAGTDGAPNGTPNPVETAATGTPEPSDAPEPPPTVAGDDGPELAPKGGDIAPDLEASEKPSSPS